MTAYELWQQTKYGNVLAEQEASEEDSNNIFQSSEANYVESLLNL